MMNIKVEEANKLSINVNDIFMADDEYFMLVKTPHGFALPSLTSPLLYLSEDQMKLNTLEEVENFIDKVREYHKFKHFPRVIYNFELTISNK